MPQDYAPAVKAGFEMAANDPPEIVTLANNAGYVVVSPADVDTALATLAASGENASIIGNLARGSRGVVIEG